MNSRIGTCAVGLFILLFGACASVNPALLEQVLGGMGQLDEGTVAAGLKEALRVGTDRTVTATSRHDGFWKNPAIRIPLPDKLQPVASGLRRVGLSGPVDDFEVAMNRAAEKAAKEAGAVFIDQVTKMTIADVFGIWKGGDTAATDYFRSTTEASLRSRFRPIVTQKMSEVGAVQIYDDLLGRWNALPLTTPPDFSPEGYVTERALQGLFQVLGDEEQKIRQDPAARTTALLQRVFGGRPPRTRGLPERRGVLRRVADAKRASEPKGSPSPGKPSPRNPASGLHEPGGS